MFYTQKGKKVLVLVFSIIITLLVMTFKSVDFVCSPWEELTMPSTLEPEDDYLFCNTGNNLTSHCMLNISEQLRKLTFYDIKISLWYYCPASQECQRCHVLFTKLSGT